MLQQAESLVDAAAIDEAHEGLIDVMRSDVAQQLCPNLKAASSAHQHRLSPIEITDVNARFFEKMVVAQACAANFDYWSGQSNRYIVL